MGVIMRRILVIGIHLGLAWAILAGCNKNSPPVDQPQTDQARPPVSASDDAGRDAAAEPATTPPASAPADLDVEYDAGPPPAAGTVIATAPAGFAEADLVGFEVDDDSRLALVFYSLAGDRVAESGRLALPAEFRLADAEGDWIDRDALAVQTTIDFAPVVLKVTAAEATVLPLPKPEELAVDKPKPGSEDEELEKNPMDPRLVVTPGEAWWAACGWGGIEDGGWCSVWVQVRLWPVPAPARKVNDGLVTARSWSWPKRAAPRGFELKKELYESGLPCSGGGTRSELHSPDGESLFMEARWLSAKPPRLLVTWGMEGLSDYYASYIGLHAGCTAVPEMIASEVGVGPGSLWLARELVFADGIPRQATELDDVPRHWVVYRGTKPLGALAEPTQSVRFRPPG